MKKIYILLSSAFQFQKHCLFLSILKKGRFSFQKLSLLFLGCIFLTSVNNKVYADVTLTTSPVAASNIAQGTSNNIVYIVKMDVSTLPVVVNSIQFTLSGTHDNNDLLILNIYFNASAPSLTGATQVANASALFAAPHPYNVPFNFVGSLNISAGTSGYFIIAANVASSATNGNTVKLDGAANPVSFGYTTSPIITDNQTNIAGIKTITGVLPLTLISFTGNVTSMQEVKMQWITAGELNTKDFEIEWSQNGQQFSEIALLAAAGNSSQNVEYTYIHKMPADGNNYYRLKMSDNDGKLSYSPVIKITVARTKAKIGVFPNPVNKNGGTLNLQLQNLNKGTYIISIYNQQGQRVFEQKIDHFGTSVHTINLRKIAAGIYKLEVRGGSASFVKTFMVE